MYYTHKLNGREHTRNYTLIYRHKQAYLGLPEFLSLLVEEHLFRVDHDDGRGRVREVASLPGDVTLHCPAIRDGLCKQQYNCNHITD